MRFFKLHACGNSILAINGEPGAITTEQATLLLNAQYGIGADNLLLYSFSNMDLVGEDGEDIDCYITGFNIDGTKVGLCANGARSLTWLLHSHHSLKPKKGSSFHLNMDGVHLFTKIEDSLKKICSIEVPPPVFDLSKIPYTGELSTGKIEVLDREFEFAVVDIGNPHCVLLCDEPISEEFVLKYGKSLEGDLLRFPERVNVEFCSLSTSLDTMRLSVYERATGLVTSSGSCSMAASVVAMRYWGAPKAIRVIMTGGEQTIEWREEKGNISASTTIVEVCSGEIHLPELVCSRTESHNIAMKRKPLASAKAV